MKNIFRLFLVTFSIQLNAQIVFEKVYDHLYKFETGRSLVITSDSNYVFTGTNNILSPPCPCRGTAYLMKVNQFGDTIFAKSFPYPSDGYSLKSTFDGGFIIGATIGYDTAYTYLIKTTAAGDTLWTKKYLDGGRLLAVTPDSGFLSVGNTILKTDSTGDSLWVKDGGVNLSLHFSSVDVTNDNGFILTGETTTPNRDIVLVKLNAGGDTVWTKTFDAGSSDHGDAVKVLNGGDMIIAATSDDTSSFSFKHDVWIIRTNAAGDSIWSRKFSGVDSYQAYDISLTSDGGFIIAGLTYNYDTYEGDLLLIKTDSLGTVQWTRTFSEEIYDAGFSVRQTYDEGFIVVGMAQDVVWDWKSDIYLIKTDNFGNSDSSFTNLFNTKNFVPEIMIYPNPTFNPFTVANIPYGIETLLQIVNPLGEIVFTQKLSGKKEYVIDAKLKEGIYFVNVSDGWKDLWLGKLVVL